MITYIHKQKVSPLIIDKVYMTMPVATDQESMIFKNIHRLLEDGYAKNKYTSMYSLSADVLMGDFNQNKLLVQCSPKHPDTSYFRAEFNPAKADMSEVRAYIDSVLPNGYESLVEHGICTRLDVTVDLHHCDINELLIWKPGISKTSGYYKGGKIETYYLGSPTSPKRICNYDKVAEIKRKNAQSMFKKDVPTHAITRIEARLTDRVPVIDLPTTDNLFSALNIAAHQSISTDDWQFILFLKVCQSEGAQNALLSLPDTIRKVYRKILQTHNAKWWNPDEIWQQWPNVIDSLLHPPASNFHLLHNDNSVVIGG